MGLGLVLALAAMGLADCVSDCTRIGYAGMVQKLSPPRAGQARIVVLQEKSNGFADGAAVVKLDGSELGLLKPGTNPGPVDIMALDEVAAHATRAELRLAD